MLVASTCLQLECSYLTTTNVMVATDGAAVVTWRRQHRLAW